MLGLLLLNLALFLYFVFSVVSSSATNVTRAKSDIISPSNDVISPSSSGGKEVTKNVVVSDAPTEFAFLTLCTNVKTLPAVLVQQALLRNFNSKHELLVMVSEKTPQWVADVLQARGTKVFRMPGLQYNFIGAPMYARGKWKEAVVKLRMFQMQYAKMVFLDADVLVQDNVDEIFDIAIEKDAIVGSLDLHDCVGPETYKGFNKLNTGVLLFRPSLENWNALMENYKNAPQRPNWKSDQVKQSKNQQFNSLIFFCLKGFD